MSLPCTQWQDELDRRFHLPFDILTNDRLEAARSGNAFTEMPLCIVRLDTLSRNDISPNDSMMAVTNARRSWKGSLKICSLSSNDNIDDL
jgi:hypothetical protein